MILRCFTDLFSSLNITVTAALISHCASVSHYSRTQVLSLFRHRSLSLSPTSSSSLSYDLRSRAPSLSSSSPAAIAAAPGTGRRHRSLSCHCLAVSLTLSLRPSSPETEAAGPGTSSSSSATLAISFLPVVGFLRTTWSQFAQKVQESLSLKRRYKFWETQHVGQFKDVRDTSLPEGPIEAPTPLSEVKQDPLLQLMNDALIVAKQKGYSVTNALDVMQNEIFLKELKFGLGDGKLHYYLYNYWIRNGLKPSELGLELL
ncbi:hypothetical protein HN873_033694 [Arachis hypogaea]